MNGCGVEKINNYYNSTFGQQNHQDWNSAIGPKQQKWLLEELSLAERENQKVIIYSHLPLLPIESTHVLWNNAEILKIIESNANVEAFISGHDHAGSYVYKNGIHHVTLFGMLDTAESSYAILEIFKNSIQLNGFGNQESLSLNFQ